MSDLCTFTPSMLEDYAQWREFHPLVNGEGRVLIRFNGDDDVPAMDCWLSSEADHQIASVVVYTRDPIPVDEAFAVSTCDAWHRTHRWPTAYTVMRDDGVEIVLEGYLIVSQGVTELQLAEFLDTHIRAAISFWEELGVARRLRAA